MDGTTPQTSDELKQRLRLALETGRLCAFDYDVARDRLHCSAETSPVVGTALQTLHGSLSELLAYVHSDDRARFERAIRDAIDRCQELEIESRVVLGRSDRGHWLLIKGVVIRDPSGRASRIVGVARDNTARHEGVEVRRAQSHGERLRALGEMASGIAHDLNQSLALITGYSDMARQELNVNEPDLAQVREMVEITAQAALEGGHALRGLLTFVRSQELMAEADKVDVAELLQDAARLTAPRWRDATQAEGHPIKLEVDAEPDCIITGSPPALREAITNLIFNAVDAMPNGGTIGLRAHHDESRIVVEVCDTGMGIAPEIRSKIFDPFFTTKGERGTGLGLAQVTSIVERHAGTVELDSTPGRGTTFRLCLPSSGGVPTPAEKQSAESATAPQRHIRILVVEDEQQLARMAALVLTQRGHIVVVAGSGDEAIGYLRDAPFDLVISDLGLGAGKNGWDVSDAVRTHRPGTRFVLVTGWGAAIDLTEARARGVDRIIAKPYRIAELRQVADDVAASLAVSSDKG